METKEEDVVDHLISTWTLQDLMLFTNKGRIFVTKVYELPTGSRTSKGTAIVNLLQLSPDEKVTTLMTFDSKEKSTAKYFIMGTRRGVVKKTEISAYANVRKTGIIAIKLNDDDQLNWVKTSTGKDAVIMVSRDGQAIQFPEVDIRPMGRSAAGVRGMKLRTNDEVMSMDVIPAEEVIKGEKRKRVVEPDLLVVLQNGLGKRTALQEFRDQARGGVGIKAAKVTEKTGKLVEAMITYGELDDIIIVSDQGQLIRLPLKSVKRIGRDTQGVTLMRLAGGDRVSSVSFVQKGVGDSEDMTTDEKNSNPTPENVAKTSITTESTIETPEVGE
jgi:DNA gyrase subunit A